MKKILFFLFIISGIVSVSAQQDHQYTQFMYNKLMINPAYSGARGVPTISGIFRQQWVGFKGAPQSFLVSFTSPFLSDRVGVGVTVSHLKIGLDRDFRASLAYSYDVIAEDNLSLRIGIAGAIRSLGIDFSAAQSGNPDPSLGNSKVNDVYGNVGAGVYATFVERFYVGVAAPRIYTNVIGFDNPAATLLAKEARHYYGMAGGVLPLSEGLNLMPAVLVKYVANAPFDADVNLNLEVREKFTVGLSYRLGGDGAGDSVDLLAYWQVTDQMGLGAAYDFSLSRLKDNTAGSFEIMAQADLKKKKKNMSNPRFFL